MEDERGRKEEVERVGRREKEGAGGREREGALLPDEMFCALAG
jgi:hypothetical protein